MKLEEIINFIEKNFPAEYAEDFDNIGLICGRRETEISKVLVCLDCDIAVVSEAVEKGAQLIITHHPVIFNSIKRITDETLLGNVIITSLENKISLYSAHTNFDSSPGALTDSICEMLNLRCEGALEEKVGRICIPENEETVYSLCDKIKKVFGIREVYTTATSNRKVNKIALCNGGGGGETAQAALHSGADIYISGDLKHHEIRNFLHSGTDYIEIRHHDCEKVFIELMCTVLKKQFEGRIDVLPSEENSSPLRLL